MRSAKYLAIFLSVWILLEVLIGASATSAVISACSAAVSPHVFKTNFSGNLTFTVTNNAPTAAAVWIKVTASSADYEILSGSASGWSTNLVSPTEIVFQSGSLAPASSVNLAVTVQTGPSQVTSANWPVQASDAAGGAGAVSCSGNTAVAISNDTTPPVISTITASSITASSATVSWTTDEASTSEVDYGTTTSYGSNKSDASLVTSHALNLTGLLAGTTYHYIVKSSDAVGNSRQSADSTFQTSGAAASSAPSASPSPSPAAPAPATSSTSSTSSSTSSPAAPAPTPAPTPPPDTTPPAVFLTTDLSKPFKKPPALFGTAFDDRLLNRVEYSLDNGRNWLPVSFLSAPNSAKTNFSISLRKLDDGNYALLLRTFDAAGNRGYSQGYTLIIDSLPPTVTGGLFSIGPQAITPLSNGAMLALAGLGQRITLSSIGGALRMDLIVSTSANLLAKSFSIGKDPVSGFWSGAFNLGEAGRYTLAVQAVDGAGNKTVKTLGELEVLPQGVVAGPDGPLGQAQIKVYYFDQVTQSFVPWDGEAFSQSNPVLADQSGHYKLLLPPGRFYLEVSAKGYQTAVSNIFTLGQTIPVDEDFRLEKTLDLQLGFADIRWSGFPRRQVFIDPAGKLTRLARAGMTQHLPVTLPDFKLSNAQMTVDSNSILGKAAIITVLNSWMPDTQAQLDYLDGLDSSKIRAIVVMPLESAGFVSSFQKIGNYKTPIFADPVGKFANNLGVQFMPGHFILDKAGRVRSVRTGLLKTRELLDN